MEIGQENRSHPHLIDSLLLCKEFLTKMLEGIQKIETGQDDSAVFSTVDGPDFTSVEIELKDFVAEFMVVSWPCPGPPSGVPLFPAAPPIVSPHPLDPSMRTGLCTWAI